MANADIDIIADLTWRGLIQQSTDPERLSTWLAASPRTVYAGFDPTAESLHVGSLVPLYCLRRFQQAGHRPVALVGGATGMIGDPSGKSKERNLLDEEALQKNVAGIERQMRAFLDFDGPQGALIVNNYDWMSRFSCLDFLRVVGKNVPVNVMLAKDSVKSRLDSEAGLSYTEFSYMLLQAYDFVHLSQRHDCQLQVGGADQWGNITAGIDMARRMHGTQLHGLTFPLLTKSDGSKMGKTEDGTVWLDPARTSPYAFYQYWINVGDDDVANCLRMLTDLSADEIQQLDQSREAAPQQRDSQTRLAVCLTELVHGADGLRMAELATRIFFGEPIANLDERQLIEVFGDDLVVEVPWSRLDEGLPLIEALRLAGLAKSNSEARRTIEQGGAYVNNVRFGEVDAVLSRLNLASESLIVLRSGRRKYAVLRFV